jgi:hypothetical protein
MSVDALLAWRHLIAGPGDDDDDDDGEAPIGDPPDDDDDFDDEDDDDDEEPLQAAFCIAASPSAPGHGTMSRPTRVESVAWRATSRLAVS